MWKKKERILKEIDILVNSQERDKFNFNIKATGAIAFIILVTGFTLSSFAGEFWNRFYGGLISLFLLGVYYYYFCFEPIKKSYNKKQDMIVLRYNELGIKWEDLQKELDILLSNKK